MLEHQEFRDAAGCTHEVLDGQGSDVALQELGVTPPLGFWDPLGLSKFDDPEAFWFGMGFRSFFCQKRRFRILSCRILDPLKMRRVEGQSSRAIAECRPCPIAADFPTCSVPMHRPCRPTTGTVHARSIDPSFRISQWRRNPVL